MIINTSNLIWVVWKALFLCKKKKKNNLNWQEKTTIDGAAMGI